MSSPEYANEGQKPTNIPDEISDLARQVLISPALPEGVAPNLEAVERWAGEHSEEGSGLLLLWKFYEQGVAKLARLLAKDTWSATTLRRIVTESKNLQSPPSGH